MAQEWWDPRGKMAVLHKFNPVRLAFIRDAACKRFGRNAKQEPAAEQTLASFNGEGKSIEWRGVRDADGKLKPFAAIMRWTR